MDEINKLGVMPKKQDSITSEKPTIKTKFSRLVTAITQKNYLIALYNRKLGFNRKVRFRKLNEMKISSMPLKTKDIKRLTFDSLTTIEQENLLQNAEMAALPYYQDISKINNIASSSAKVSATNDWEISKDMSALLVNLIKQDPTVSKKFKTATFDIKNSRIIDKKTGLTAYVIENKASKEVRVIFGGTSSGKHAGGLINRHLNNSKQTMVQWIANIKNVVYKKAVPASYDQASSLIETMNKALETNKKTDYKLTVMGHSKGAAEATFAALTQENPCNAICFSNAELGTAALSRIPRENLKKADSLINSYYIAGDIVPNISRGFRSLAKLGTFYKIPSASKYSSFIDRHDKFFKHIRSFVKL
jgi:DNA replication protein DnaC